MKNITVKKLLVILSIALFVVTGCSKKHQPQGAEVSNTANEKTAEEKKVIKKAVKMPLAKVITVDDRAAKKTPDGRLYYDFEGKRYWKNFDDGKYYLFSKTMYSNPAFKPH